MTARCYPEQVHERDGRIGEVHVWRLLRDALPDDAVLMYSVHVPVGKNGREIDLLVLWPGVGIAVVEVKGGTVWCSPDGTWRSERSGRATRIIGNPMEQVESARHDLTRFLLERKNPASRARVQHVVVLPHTSVAATIDATSCPRRQVIDEKQLPDLVRLIKDLVESGSGHVPLAAADVSAVVELFTQELPQDPQAFTREEQERGDQLASQQVDVLDLLSRQPRFTIIGGAGSGKTVLALEQARRLVKEGKRVALVCYSRGLGRHLKQQVEAWDRSPAFTGTFEELALLWGVPSGDGTSAYYEDTLPRGRRAVRLSRRGPAGVPAARGRAGRGRAVPAAQEFPEHQEHRPDLRLPGQ